MRAPLLRGIATVSEPIFLRVRRVITAGAEVGVDALERVTGASLLRQALRQVDRACGEARAEHEAASARSAQAGHRQGKIRERIADLDDKARFAIGKGRGDLAEAALSSQLDLEAELARLDLVQAEAADHAARLDACIADLAARKTQLERELAAFETARRDGKAGAHGAACQERIQRTVARSEETFERVMARASIGPVAPAGAEETEIDSLRKSALLAERMAALRAAKGAKRKKPRG